MYKYSFVVTTTFSPIREKIKMITYPKTKSDNKLNTELFINYDDD